MGYLNYKYKDVLKRMTKLGFVLKRRWKWDHEIWINEKNGKIITIPNRWSKNLSKWVIKSIIKTTWLSNYEFKELK